MAHLLVGIDVGGPRKGFHAVAVRARTLVDLQRFQDAAGAARWALSLAPDAIAIDAPCRWRVDQPRLAERELARARISSFPTPTEERARGHSFFTWMIAGAQLYAALAPAYPVYTDEIAPHRVCIETFPQAVACAMAGSIVSAKQKRSMRLALLQTAGFASDRLRSTDDIDAMLCAVAAEAFVTGDFNAYGDNRGGFIVVPRTAITPTTDVAMEP